MSLDLSKVAAQIWGMVGRLKAGGEERRRRLSYALEVLGDKTTDLDKLKNKIEASRTTWMVAGLVDGLAGRYKAPPLPPEFTVIAADGSHIDVDRHKPTRCYLINIGSVTLRYGDQPDATLDSFPSLYAEDEDLVLAPPGIKGREQPIEGALLGIKRSIEECRHLAQLSAGLPPGSSSLALLDGSLILWGLSNRDCPEFVIEALLNRGFLLHLEEMRKLSRDRRLALASYISFPRSSDVDNVLRVALCSQEVVDTDRNCPDCTSRECEMVAGVQDRELFASLLEPGERSEVFVSRSSIVRNHYGAHTVCFFYLRSDEEIARVEVPQWVANDVPLLNLAHTLVLDQCRRGQGYPVALSEAHEQAVVTTADKENFWQLVEASLEEERLPTVGSAKNRSKRTRWV